MQSIRVFGLAMVLCLVGCKRTPSLDGMWDATVTRGSTEVPFRFAIEGKGDNLRGSFFNGDDKITSASASVHGHTVVFSYPEYGTTLEVTAAANGRLEGLYTYTSDESYRVEAQRFRQPQFGGEVPTIEGLWTIGVPAKKNEQAWHLIVRQAGAEVSASILRLDGDSGAATGSYDGHKFVLGHFSGARPLRLELTPQLNGTLTVELNSYDIYTAFPADEARGQGLPEPADPSQFARLKDPGAPFHFSFPNVDGQVVSDTDARFRHKVVIVIIGGSWCPGCHDEMPFMVDLYRRYREKGLEIVFLSFEEGRQLMGLERLRAFITRYHIDFPVLVAGDTRLVHIRLPQIVNLEAFPTTLYVGRDGMVRGLVTGFAGRAAGPFHTNRMSEMVAKIERLLAER